MYTSSNGEVPLSRKQKRRIKKHDSIRHLQQLEREKAPHKLGQFLDIVGCEVLQTDDGLEARKSIDAFHQPETVYHPISRETPQNIPYFDGAVTPTPITPRIVGQSIIGPQVVALQMPISAEPIDTKSIISEESESVYGQAVHGICAIAHLGDDVPEKPSVSSSLNSVCDQFSNFRNTTNRRKSLQETPGKVISMRILPPEKRNYTSPGMVDQIDVTTSSEDCSEHTTFEGSFAKDIEAYIDGPPEKGGGGSQQIPMSVYFQRSLASVETLEDLQSMAKSLLQIAEMDVDYTFFSAPELRYYANRVPTSDGDEQHIERELRRATQWYAKELIQRASLPTWVLPTRSPPNDVRIRYDDNSEAALESHTLQERPTTHKAMAIGNTSPANEKDSIAKTDFACSRNVDCASITTDGFWTTFESDTIQNTVFFDPSGDSACRPLDPPTSHDVVESCRTNKTQKPRGLLTAKGPIRTKSGKEMVNQMRYRFIKAQLERLRKETRLLKSRIDTLECNVASTHSKHDRMKQYSIKHVAATRKLAAGLQALVDTDQNGRKRHSINSVS